MQETIPGSHDDSVMGRLVELDSGAYYKIENAQDMPAFFINLATASDVWVFLSSHGALTAGRQNADGAVFPYETDDRLHLAAATGPKTLVRLSDGRIWEPFSHGFEHPNTVQRNLYKRLTGDAVIFEEINETLALRFTYRWETSERYGIVRTACLENQGQHPVEAEVLDGVQNILPSGVSQGLADSSSCLTDAYKACERFGGGSLAVFSLTSAIVDTPEPVEILRANTVWSISRASSYLLSSRQITAFARGRALTDETRSTGRKGAYFMHQAFSLAPGAAESWLLVMDARMAQTAVARLSDELTQTPPEVLRTRVEEDIARGVMELTRIVASADGLQCTADQRATARHYMNVLYNNMRGGVFIDGYTYDPDLFTHFAQTRDHALVERREDFFKSLHTAGDHSVVSLKREAYADGDPDLIRICLEFLPLSFSRRHGDPSRPWNRFHIRVKDDNGRKLYHYEGNWRDIFQNWEAMSLSFPEYLDAIIAKFFNASTVDGFNPYRLNADGIDWEVPEPHNPFSGYGYWGDHQIIYLLKLLEWLEAYDPAHFTRLTEETLFAYADVPYEIKPYASLLQDAKNTITFNYARHEQIMKRAEACGTDGKLRRNADGVYYAPFMEKLLVPVLAKLSNWVPGGGIWMNTQRPEWNDANNAIVGNGLSMVTVYQLYRHLLFAQKTVQNMGRRTVALSVEVARWLTDIRQALTTRAGRTPRAILDALGESFDRYRAAVYAQGFSGREHVACDDIASFLNEALAALKETIESNKRADGLYNAYNILRLTPGGLTVSPMFPMLEGQTAVLGSGALTPDEALTLVSVMEQSGLYSPEHQTFYLYPVKQLKTFMERNVIPQEAAEACLLAARLIADGHEGLLLKDADGQVRFHDTIQQSADVEKWLALLHKDERYAALADVDGDTLRELYEQVFAHRQFTGRSGIMYKYEGIGSIYWHQNAKFLLSFQECFSQLAGTADQNADSRLKSMKDAYYRLRAGFGFNKEPSLWGAFPLEPYSHTPMGQPAQQPGMTGQVKEDIITRYAELGLCVRNGIVHFTPALLKRSEFLSEAARFTYFTVDGVEKTLLLDAGSLAFTICQTPVIYRLASENSIAVYTHGRLLYQANTLSLDESTSRRLFARDGSIDAIHVNLCEQEWV